MIISRTSLYEELREANRRLEEQGNTLRQKNAQLAHAIEKAETANHAKGRFLACNQALSSFNGQPVESFLGKTLFDCVPPEATRSAREDEEAIVAKTTMQAAAEPRVVLNPIHSLTAYLLTGIN